MTEKRFVYYEHKGADYILDNPNTELDFIEMLGDALETEEIVDKLNELSQLNYNLTENAREYQKIARIVDKQNKQLEKENKELKQRIGGLEDYKEASIKFTQEVEDFFKRHEFDTVNFDLIDIFFDGFEFYSDKCDELKKENKELKQAIKEVLELLKEEVDLFTDEATEHDIKAYIELREFDNKDAYYMATATKKAIKLLKEMVE